MANIEIDEKLVQQIKENIKPKDTQELSDIWKKNDREEYSSEAFEAIRELLLERGEELPHQDEYSKESTVDVPAPKEEPFTKTVADDLNKADTFDYKVLDERIATMKGKPESIWAFMNSSGKVVFAGNKEEVQLDARKRIFTGSIDDTLKYSIFDKPDASWETQKPEWKDMDDLFYTEAGISKKAFHKRTTIEGLIGISGLLLIVVGGSLFVAKVLFPEAKPVEVGFILGKFLGLVAGTVFVWKRFGPIAGILTLIGGFAFLF